MLETLVTGTFTPTTTDPRGPGSDGWIQFHNRSTYEGAAWFRVTTMMAGTAGALGGTALATTFSDNRVAVVAMAGLGAAAGIWLGNRTAPR